MIILQISHLLLLHFVPMLPDSGFNPKILDFDDSWDFLGILSFWDYLRNLNSYGRLVI